MNNLYKGESTKCIIDEDDEVLVLKGPTEAQMVPWHVIRAY
jgi:hypothetical protein